MNTTSYRYKANDKDSYLALMNNVSYSFATVTLIPSEFTIIVTPPAEHPEQICEIGEFIDKEGLNFQIEPIEESKPSLEIELDECRKALKYQKNETQQYQKWWQDARQRENRVMEQIHSIAILLNSIYPS